MLKSKNFFRSKQCLRIEPMTQSSVAQHLTGKINRKNKQGLRIEPMA